MRKKKQTLICKGNGLVRTVLTVLSMDSSHPSVLSTDPTLHTIHIYQKRGKRSSGKREERETVWRKKKAQHFAIWGERKEKKGATAPFRLSQIARSIAISRHLISLLSRTSPSRCPFSLYSFEKNRRHGKSKGFLSLGL